MNCARCKYGYTPYGWEPLVFCYHSDRKKTNGCPLETEKARREP